jgi:hypothetical protein
MIVTEKDREIRNWINKNKDNHKWVTHTMLDLYAKHYHQEQVEKLNIDDVVVPKGTLCDVCGSENTIGAPHMGSNCLDCNPL